MCKWIEQSLNRCGLMFLIALTVIARASGAESDSKPALLLAPFDAAAARGAQQAWAKYLGKPISETAKSVGSKVVLISPGEFVMGSPDAEIDEARRITLEATREWFVSEKPPHRVRISKPFYLGVCEITQQEFTTIIGRNPSEFSATGSMKEMIQGRDTDRFPVENVPWNDAIEFCNKLSEKESLKPFYRITGIRRNRGSIAACTVTVEGGRGYRLPTEAEWEYACRAGTTTPFNFGEISNGTAENTDGTRPFGTKVKGQYFGGRTTSVGSYRPNAFGLFDMHGNVGEWCWDWQSDKYFEASPLTDPTGPPSGIAHVGKGGSAAQPGLYARSGSRAWSPPGVYVFETGLRVARSL
jgi:formylglycine-generating enzyme required for sulfatase activity